MPPAQESEPQLFLLPPMFAALWDSATDEIRYHHLYREVSVGPWYVYCWVGFRSRADTYVASQFSFISAPQAHLTNSISRGQGHARRIWRDSPMDCAYGIAVVPWKIIEVADYDL